MSATIRKLLVCTAFLLIFASPSVQAKWVKVKTENFFVISEKGEKHATKFARDLEDFRRFIVAMNGGRKIGRIPRLPIYMTRDDRKYKKLTGSKKTAGIFKEGNNGPFAIMYNKKKRGRFDLDGLQVILHEYIHHLNATSQDVSFPLWYSEGIAEFLASSRPHKEGMTLGAVLMSRLPALKFEKWYSAEKLMQARRVPKRGDVFYAQSWLLTHMLHFQQNYRPGYNEFANQILHGTKPAAALNAVYGQTFVDIDAALKAYLKQGKLGYAVVPWTPKEARILEVIPVTKAEAKLLEKRLAYEFSSSPLNR